MGHGEKGAGSPGVRVGIGEAGAGGLRQMDLGGRRAAEGGAPLGLHRECSVTLSLHEDYAK